MLSIIIPAFNEEEVLGSTVDGLASKFQEHSVDAEFVLVNNNSTDRTKEIMLALSGRYEKVVCVDTPKVAGYGVAVRWGLYHSSGDIVVIVMADASEDPSDVLQFYRMVNEEGYDCAFGTRFSGNARVTNYPFVKKVLNRLGNRLIGLLVGGRYGDFTNGFKCYRREQIDAMQPLISSEFNLTIEMSIKAVQNRANFCVVEHSWKDRTKGESKFALLRQSSLYISTIIFCIIVRRLRGADWTCLNVIPRK